MAADLEERLGQAVDLVVLNRAPVDLIHRVLRDGILVYERDRSARIRFEVQVSRFPSLAKEGWRAATGWFGMSASQAERLYLKQISSIGLIRGPDQEIQPSAARSRFSASKRRSISSSLKSAGQP